MTTSMTRSQATPLPPAQTAAVRLEGVTKRYDQVVAVDNVSLEVQKGEFVCLLGPSGCGKTTTLRMIAGYIPLDGGRISIDGVDMANRPPNKRDLGMVYQNYALFPHMTVFENVAFGLEMRKVDKRELRERVRSALEIVELAGFEERKPGQLSGGQQQRVALARATVIGPTVLLLDEPLSNLDAKLRKNMQLELRALQRRLGMTTIHVTHDQEEALTLSDRLVIMNQGQVMQVGSPREIYESPTSTFVADFIGRSNFFRGRVERVDGDGRAEFVAEGGERLVIRCERPVEPGTMADVFIRPEKIRLAPIGRAVGEGNVVPGEVVLVVYSGNLVTAEVDLASGKRLLAERPSGSEDGQYNSGQRVDVVLPPEGLRLLPAQE
jgi:spermidine/putrescine ABC transporter ATP-binding subunit